MPGAYERALREGMTARLAAGYALGTLEAQIITLTAYRRDDDQ